VNQGGSLALVVLISFGIKFLAMFKTVLSKSSTDSSIDFPSKALLQSNALQDSYKALTLARP